MVANILVPRFEYKTSNGFEYPQYFEYWEKALSSVWNYKVGMTEDILNWESASEYDRKIIGGILRAFTQTECVVGDVWIDYCKKFRKPEILMMAIMFAMYEGLHQAAYNHLSSSLGIDEYKAYMSDKTAQDKINYLLNDIDSLKVRLAVFSGAVEGVALFSAFSILLSYCKQGTFKGLSQIISWSINDESAHSDAGGDLFKDLVKEDNITDGEIELIIEGFDNVLKNELVFLDNIIKDGDSINGIRKECFINFLYSRYNNRLANLNIDHSIDYDKDLSYEVSSWFNLLASGQTNQDFFAYMKDGSQYVAKPTFDKAKVDWSSLANRYLK